MAYSRILHIAIFIGRICIGDRLSFKISYLRTIIHSFCRCGLFYIGFLFRLKTGDRTILNFKSMGRVDKFLLKFYIYFMFARAGAPPSLNLFLEVVMFARSSRILIYLVNIFFLSLVLARVCVVIPIRYSLGGGDLKKGDRKKLFNKLKIFNNVYLLLAILVLTTILANFFVLDFLLLN